MAVVACDTRFWMVCGVFTIHVPSSVELGGLPSHPHGMGQGIRSFFSLEMVPSMTQVVVTQVY